MTISRILWRSGRGLGLVCLLTGLATLAALAGGPPGGKLPTQAEAADAQAKYLAEREAVVKAGADKMFLPQLMQKAEEIARRGDAALKGGRLLQASDAFRQARWQLPYLAPEVPGNVAHVLGSLRLRHGHEITSLAYNANGTRLVTASRDRTVKVWDLSNGHELFDYRGHGDYVRSVAFSPDGSLVASAGGDSHVKLWDPATGKDIRTLAGQNNYVNEVAFSPDGKYLAAACNDRAIRIYNVADGTIKRLIQDFQMTVQSVAFSPDGKTMAAGVGNGQIRLWLYPQVAENANQPEYWSQQDFSGASYHLTFSLDGKTLVRSGPDAIKMYIVPLPGAPVQASALRRSIPPPRDHAGKIHRYTCTTFSKDGKTLFAGCTDGLIYLFDGDGAQSMGTFKGHNGEVKALAFNRDGSQLASASADHTVRFWQFDVISQSRDLANHDGPVWSAAFSPDGSRVVTASSDKSVKVWETVTGKMLHLFEGHTAGVTSALFSPDGKTVVSTGADKAVKLWDADKGEIKKTLLGHTGTVTAADFSSDSKRVASGGADQLLKIWDVDNFKELVSVDTGSVIAAVVYTVDGKQVVTGNVDQTIQLWDANTGKPLRRWLAHGAAVTGLSCSRDGKLLASCGADQLVRIWRLEDPNAPPITFSGHTGQLSSVAFRGDGRYVVSAGADQVIKLWKIDDGSTKDAAQDFRGHRDWVTSVAFSRDGFYIASSSVDKTVKVWEVTSREIPLVSEHTGSVDAVAVSPDGKLIASGATDRTIKLWDRTTGNELMTLTGHGDSIIALAFTPDSKTLVSSAGDRTIKRWDVTTGRELPIQPGHQQHFVGFVNPVQDLAVSPDGLRLLAWVPGNERYTMLRVFDLATGNPLLGGNDQGRNVASVAFAKDAKQAAVGAVDGSVRIYTLDKAMEMRPGGDWFLFDNNVGISVVAYSPDGNLLIAGSDKGTVKVCGVAKKDTQQTIKAHEGRVTVTTVSPDGKRFATAGSDNVVKLWETASGKLLREWPMRMPIQERGGFIGELAFTPDGRNLITANANTTLYVLDLP